MLFGPDRVGGRRCPNRADPYRRTDDYTRAVGPISVHGQGLFYDELNGRPLDRVGDLAVADFETS